MHLHQQCMRAVSFLVFNPEVIEKEKGGRRERKKEKEGEEEDEGGGGRGGGITGSRDSIKM